MVYRRIGSALERWWRVKELWKTGIEDLRALKVISKIGTRKISSTSGETTSAPSVLRRFGLSLSCEPKAKILAGILIGRSMAQLADDISTT